ncbi:MAG: signal peptidase II [Gemmatimonadaceae bacterium]
MKSLLFWPILVVVVLVDVITKSLAVALLAPSGVPHSVIGEGVRLAIVYNPGAAFGLYLGSYSRWIFMALTAGALVILWRLFKYTVAGDYPRILAISFVAAGAIGNLLDRIRTDLGVVDFIDVGFGAHRWPTFNVADMAVSGGALLLAFVLWGEDKRAALAAAAAPTPSQASVPNSTVSSLASAPMTSTDSSEHS